MEVFFLSFLVFFLAVLGMAVGALMGRRPLAGGCGGTDCAAGAGIGCGACGVGGRDGKTKDRRSGRPAADSFSDRDFERSLRTVEPS